MIQQPLSKKISFVPVLFFCLVFNGTVSSTPPLSPELHKSILSVIDLVYHGKYKDSEDEAKRLIRHFPDQPAGYFCMAFVLDNWMGVYQDDKKEDEFYRYCDLAIEKGEQQLSSNRKNEWARFFIAGADGFKGTYEARYERWITAFRLGWKGVAVLLELESEGCTIPDIHYGIASYNYWRSALMKMLWWMPGIEDKREEAISTLYEVSDKALFTGELAVATLVDVLINEKRFKEALKLAEKQLKKYPEYTPLRWSKVRALSGLNRHAEAGTEGQRLIEIYTGFTPNNHYMEVLCRLQLINVYSVEKKFQQVLSECGIVKTIELERKVRKRLESELGKMKTAEKAAKKELKSRRQNGK